jgi:sporulation protein YlmC with PRC-barrel domain
MQVSELLGLDVLNTTEQRVGTVVDVRLTVDGELDDGSAAPTMFGLLVSPRTRSSYLGYERSDARRPALLAAILRWRHRGTFLVLWDDIARVDDETVRLHANFGRYSPTLPDDD